MKITIEGEFGISNEMGKKVTTKPWGCLVNGCWCYICGGREGGGSGGWELRLLSPRGNMDLRFIPGRGGRGERRIDMWGFGMTSWCL